MAALLSWPCCEDAACFRSRAAGCPHSTSTRGHRPSLLCCPFFLSIYLSNPSAGHSEHARTQIETCKQTRAHTHMHTYTHIHTHTCARTHEPTRTRTHQGRAKIGRHGHGAHDGRLKGHKLRLLEGLKGGLLGRVEVWDGLLVGRVLHLWHLEDLRLHEGQLREGEGRGRRRVGVWVHGGRLQGGKMEMGGAAGQL